VGLSGTIVRLMISDQRRAKKNAGKIQREKRFFYIYKERMCMCVYIYVYIYSIDIVYIYPDPDPDRPDPEGSSPIVYFIVCASVIIALVFGLPFPTKKV
jgi:hypothetical protein